jgi:hypothetical protein
MAVSASVLLLSLAACGGDSGDSAAADTAQGGQAAGRPATDGPQGGPGAGRFPGANGLIADISGKTLQVQAQDSQTAVTYTDTTTFTAQVAAKLADVKVGSCVQVSPAQIGSSSGDAAAITAATVRITPATDGSCAPGGMGGGRPGADAPSGMPTDLPTDLPTDRPSGAPSGGPGGRGFGAFGQVTAVSASGFTLAQQAFGPGQGRDQSGETTEVTVTVASDTTFTTTKKSSAAALAVGKCVSATGQADDTGAIAAERISVSEAVDGRCTGGFGGFGGRGPGAGQVEGR